MADDNYTDTFDADDEEDVTEIESLSTIIESLDDVIEQGESTIKPPSARSRIEDYFEQRRLRDEEGDYDLDFDIDL